MMQTYNVILKVQTVVHLINKCLTFYYKGIDVFNIDQIELQ